MQGGHWLRQVWAGARLRFQSPPIAARAAASAQAIGFPKGVISCCLRRADMSAYSLRPLVGVCRAIPAASPLHGSNTLWRAGVPTVANGRRIYCTKSEGASRHIGRYPIPYKKDLPYDIVELMEEVRTKGGFLPNVYQVMSHRPAEFRAFFSFYNAIMNRKQGNLSKADRELIVVATSIHNKCPYCVIAHSALHRIYSKNPNLADQMMDIETGQTRSEGAYHTGPMFLKVIVNWELAELGEREKAMLNFALVITRSENVTEEHFMKLEEHGFDREDAWDIAMISAFFAMSNRIAHFTDMRPNIEFYSLGRVPREKEKSGALKF